MASSDILARLDAGAGALGRGDRALARRCLLGAARELLALARQSTGALRDARAERAFLLIERCARLHVSPQAERPARATGHGERDTAADVPFESAEIPDLTLDDVAGAEDVKRIFKAKYLFPLRNPDQAAAYGQSGAGGVLVYGPPGTGKTLLVKALAGELRAPVFTIRPSDIMSKWVGDSEGNVARLFEAARRHPVALIFIDEIDALAPIRKAEGSGASERVLAQFLAEVDGFAKHDSRLLFVGATNAPWDLDPALLRAGRFDALCYVGLPGKAARQHILGEYLANVPLAPDVNLEVVADNTEGCSGAEVFTIANTAAQSAYYDLIENGIARPVSADDLLRAVGQVHRAATPELLERYRGFAAGNTR